MSDNDESINKKSATFSKLGKFFNRNFTAEMIIDLIEIYKAYDADQIHKAYQIMVRCEPTLNFAEFTVILEERCYYEPEIVDSSEIGHLSDEEFAEKYIKPSNPEEWEAMYGEGSSDE